MPFLLRGKYVCTLHLHIDTPVLPFPLKVYLYLLVFAFFLAGSTFSFALLDRLIPVLVADALDADSDVSLI